MTNETASPTAPLDAPPPPAQSQSRASTPPTPAEARAALEADAQRREIACNEALRQVLVQQRCRLTVREFPEEPQTWKPDGSLVTRWRAVFEALP